PSERSAALVPQWLIERVTAPLVQTLPADTKGDSGEESPSLTPRLQEACDFLRNLLSQRPMASEDCIRQAWAAGVRPRTLRRAKHLLRIQSRRKGDGLAGQWLWYLPPLPRPHSGEPPCVASAFAAPAIGHAFVEASTAAIVMNSTSEARARANFPRDI